MEKVYSNQQERLFDVASQLAQGERKEKQYEFRKFISLGATAVCALGGAAAIVSTAPVVIPMALTGLAHAGILSIAYNLSARTIQRDKNYMLSHNNRDLYNHGLSELQEDISRQISNASDAKGVKFAVGVLRDKFMKKDKQLDQKNSI